MCLSKQTVSACAVCMRIINKLSYHIAKMCQLWFWTTYGLAGAEVASASSFRAALKRRLLYKLSFISLSPALSLSLSFLLFRWCAVAIVHRCAEMPPQPFHLVHITNCTGETYTHTHLCSFASQMVPTGRPCLHIPCQFMFHLLSLTRCVYSDSDTLDGDRMSDVRNK